MKVRINVRMIVVLCTLLLSATTMVRGEDKSNSTSASTEAAPAGTSTTTATPSSSSTDTIAAPATTEVAPAAAGASVSAPPLPVAKPPQSASKPSADKPAPKGSDSAVKLYGTAKYAPAASMFESFIKQGVDNTDTHMYLGACYQQMKKYDKALQQYDWVSKNAPLISLKQKGQAAGHSLRCYRAGICPGNCLKLSTPGWAHYPELDKSLLWMRFPSADGWVSFSTHHLGDLIVYEKGVAVDKGKCPICKGTGKVPKLN